MGRWDSLSLAHRGLGQLVPFGFPGPSSYSRAVCNRALISAGRDALHEAGKRKPGRRKAIGFGSTSKRLLAAEAVFSKEGFFKQRRARPVAGAKRKGTCLGRVISAQHPAVARK
jgi:hypothetical protein